MKESYLSSIERIKEIDVEHPDFKEKYKEK